MSNLKKKDYVDSMILLEIMQVIITFNVIFLNKNKTVHGNTNGTTFLNEKFLVDIGFDTYGQNVRDINRIMNCIDVKTSMALKNYRWSHNTDLFQILEINCSQDTD